jgi:ribosome-binding protein aMBF1 (putative translation factor)
MRCTNHRKELIGNCTWCGKHVCPLCIAKKEGRKLYCERCAIQLVGVKRVKLPKPASPEKIQETAQKQMEPTKKKLVMDEDGYLVIEQ